MNKNWHHLLLAVVNAAGFPGVGTLLAGRVRTGWIQIGLSLLFLLGSAAPLLALALGFYARGMNLARLIDLMLLRDTWIFSRQEYFFMMAAFASVCCYVANLLWSLTTTRPHHRPGPPPLPAKHP